MKTNMSRAGSINKDLFLCFPYSPNSRPGCNPCRTHSCNEGLLHTRLNHMFHHNHHHLYHRHYYDRCHSHRRVENTVLFRRKKAVDWLRQQRFIAIVEIYILLDVATKDFTARGWMNWGFMAGQMSNYKYHNKSVFK